MLDYIQDIIQRFGGRLAGTEQEKKAQEYTAGLLKKYCNHVEVEEFLSPLDAHFESLKLFSIAYVAVLILMKANPKIAAIVGVLNAILFLGHFVTYRHWLDFLYPNKASWNVIGDIEPQQEAKSTLIVAGHIDSVREFQWWYRLKQPGIVLSVIAGFLFVLQAVFALLNFGFDNGFTHVAWWIFTLATPILLVYFYMHGDLVVDGASDNLTGVAMAVEMAKVFSQKKLQHTRLRLISFGSEEPALRGATAYARKHKEQLLKENALLFNIDTIKDKEFLTVVTAEINTLVFYDKKNVELVEDSFKACDVPYKKLPVGVGASDASAFHIAGLPAVCVIGMRTDELDPSYHTRLDTVDCIDPEGLEAFKQVLTHFIESWDQRAVSKP